MGVRGRDTKKETKRYSRKTYKVVTPFTVANKVAHHTISLIHERSGRTILIR